MYRYTVHLRLLDSALDSMCQGSTVSVVSPHERSALLGNLHSTTHLVWSSVVCVHKITEWVEGVCVFNPFCTSVPLSSIFFQHATQLVGSLKVFVILGLLPTWKFLEHVITAIAFITSYFCCRLFLYLLQVVNIYLIDFVLIWQHDGLLSTNSLYAFDNDGLVFFEIVN